MNRRLTGVVGSAAVQVNPVPVHLLLTHLVEGVRRVKLLAADDGVLVLPLNDALGRRDDDAVPRTTHVAVLYPQTTWFYSRGRPVPT